MSHFVFLGEYFLANNIFDELLTLEKYIKMTNDTLSWATGKSA